MQCTFIGIASIHINIHVVYSWQHTVSSCWSLKLHLNAMKTDTWSEIRTEIKRLGCGDGLGVWRPGGCWDTLSCRCPDEDVWIRNGSLTSDLCKCESLDSYSFSASRSHWHWDGPFKSQMTPNNHLIRKDKERTRQIVKETHTEIKHITYIALYKWHCHIC